MKSKFIISAMLSLIVSLFCGVGIAAAVGAPALPFVGGLFVASFIPMPQMGGIAMETFYRQVWEKEAIKSVDDAMKDTFLDDIPDNSKYVTGDEEMQTINSLYFDVEPDVLINNTTYPIPLQELNGTPVALTLDKYQTKVTPVTDDELYALAWDKIKEVNTSHSNSIIKNRLKKAAHALAPAANAAKTPVLATTGEVTKDGTRKRLTWEDVVALREAWTNAEMSLDDLRLILCSDHVNDLLLADTAFKKAYTNFSGGVILNQLGFEIREYSANPFFDATALTKVSFGAVPGTNARRASVCFNKRLARKANGKMFIYKSEAKSDPQNQRNLIAYKNHFICLPSVQREIGAIVSALGS
ncbi:MAG: hypothetical protein ACK5JD_13685 [Mangrovibacterium sp.]